jgi:hypothetical protein
VKNPPTVREGVREEEDNDRRDQIDTLLNGFRDSMADLAALALELAEIGRNGQNGHKGPAGPRKVRSGKRR